MSGLCCGWVSVDGELNWEMAYWVVVVVVVGWKLGMGVCCGCWCGVGRVFGVVHKCVGGDSWKRDGELTVVCCLFGRGCRCCSDGGPGAVFVRVVVDGGDGVGGCDEQEGARGLEGPFLTVSFVGVHARAGGTWVGYGVEPYC